MKKHLSKIILGTAFILILAAGILADAFYPVSQQTVNTPEDGETVEVPKDYIITDSIDILLNENNYVHLDNTTIRGTLIEIKYVKGEVSRFIVESVEKEEYSISISSMDLISVNTLNCEDDDIAKAELKFRTGENIVLTEGEYVQLYKNEIGRWSFDKRGHVKSKKEEFSGIIDDFVFLPATNQQGDVYISHIVVKNQDDDTADVYPHNLEVKEMKSSGELNVYYTGNASGKLVYDTKESDDFELEITTYSENYVLKKGEHINLVQDENTGYWEIAKEIDSTRYEAEIEGFIFGHTDFEITSLDYVNLLLENGENIQLTMMQTEAVYGIPKGDYKKIYTYDAHEKLLTDIKVLEGYRMELYYEDDIVLNLSIGSKIWVYKNQEDFWVVDYAYTYESAEIEED